jgi:hypothetical protein
VRTRSFVGAEALGVLTGYMLAVCGLASVLHAFNITIKFW